MNHWVMDYETMANCFIAVFEHYKEKTRRVYVVNHLTPRSQFDEFVVFLNSNIEKGEWHISFNGLAFDAQITQYILKHYESWKYSTNDEIARLIYAYAQYIISGQEERKADYSEKDLYISQIDLFKLNHWDNAAKRSGLKWIQYSMDWDNVEDMPIHHNYEIKTVQELETVIKYCINDVQSTKKIYEASTEQIALRKSLSEEYKINLYSASETKIARELFAHFLAKDLKISKHELRKLRTERPYINLKECILDYVTFESREFTELLDFFKGKVVTETKGALNHKITYKGLDLYYGLGGIHGAVDSGIYEAEEGYTIMTSDVASYYPNLAIRNKFSPGHLNKEAFCTLYEWFFNERKKIPKDDPKNYVYKIILNSTYGLSNDENSFLYDPQLTMSITINGQLLLSKLLEMVTTGIPGAMPIMINTDGLEVMIPTCYRNEYLKICEEWEKLTKLSLEHDEYKKIIVGDVNNYIAVFQNALKSPKCKGRFEWEDLEKKKVSLFHKNKSFLIIPKGIYEYFISGTKPEDFLKRNRNVYDYCGGVKVKSDWQLLNIYVNKGEIIEEPMQKICRYYVSKAGGKLVKRNKKDGRQIQLESGKWLQSIYNKNLNMSYDDMGIDEDYYIDRIYKEIHNIDKVIKRKFEQLTLF